jgi:inositol phosphorylceramide mannosyltransferase catalytic subunit
MEKIPKIIHQIWIGPNKNPTIWTNTWSIDYINTFKDFEYKLWNNENINDILNKYPLCKIMFNMEREYCGKADILRYLILYEYGGIYIDADSVWLNNKNLNNLIEKTNYTGIFCGKEPTNEYIANGVIGCTKNNKLMLKLINNLENYIRYYDRIKPRQYKRKRAKQGCSKITGPRFFSLIMIPEKITIFQSNYFYPISWFGITETDKHKKIELPIESYMFQYGYTTNKLGNII